MKIISINTRKVIALHEGMPFVFDRNLLETHKINPSLYPEENIGTYIDNDYYQHFINYFCPYTKLLLDRLCNTDELA